MFRSTLLFIITLGLATACTEIDCPLDSVVEVQVNFYDADSHQAETLSDTMSVYGVQGDSLRLLYNRAVGVKSLTFPLNPATDRDTLLFHFSNAEGEQRTAAYIIAHQRQIHLESLDCPAAVFHRLQSITRFPSSTTPIDSPIDSIAISQPKVQYEDVENLKIYLRPTS